MEHDLSGSRVSLSPQGGVDSFGTPPGRSLTDRFNDQSFIGDSNRPLPPSPPFFSSRATVAASNWWQTAIWAAIVVLVIGALLLL